MKKILIKALIIITAIVLILYIFGCAWFYSNQEKIIFYPEKLDAQYKFNFEQSFEEIGIKTNDDIILNSLLFKADSSKGVIFYLHGNEGSLKNWANVVKTYTDLNYDIFLIDYRGYGKSEGSIKGQEEFFQDLQTVYDEINKKYAEDKIIVIGYSLGTGPAAQIASTNNPKLLILQAPYYSLVDMMKHYYSILPTFLLKYKFKTNQFIQECKMPVIIFHGDEDSEIYYGSSLKLKKLFKPGDKLITLKGQDHNGITYNQDYIKELEKILAE